MSIDGRDQGDRKSGELLLPDGFQITFCKRRLCRYVFVRKTDQKIHFNFIPLWSLCYSEFQVLLGHRVGFIYFSFPSVLIHGFRVCHGRSVLSMLPTTRQKPWEIAFIGLGPALQNKILQCPHLLFQPHSASSSCSIWSELSATFWIKEIQTMQYPNLA